MEMERIVDFSLYLAILDKIHKYLFVSQKYILLIVKVHKYHYFERIQMNGVFNLYVLIGGRSGIHSNVLLL